MTITGTKRIASGVLSLLLTSLLLFTFSVNTKAQTGKINFAGTWAFNESKSTQSQGGFRMAPSTMVITHSGTSLSVQSTSRGPGGEDFTSTNKYTTDGKECTNPMFGDNTRKSVVKWSSDGNNLVFTHTMNFERDGQTMEFKSSETWRMNPDKTMAVETVFNTPNGEMKTTNIYDKK